MAPVVGGDEGAGFEVRGEFGWGFVAYAVGDLGECLAGVSDEESLCVVDTESVDVVVEGVVVGVAYRDGYFGCGSVDVGCEVFDGYAFASEGEFVFPVFDEPMGL